MKNSIALKQTNMILSAALMLGSLVMLFSAGKIMAYPNVTSLEIHQAVAPMTSAQCASSLKLIGFNPAATDGLLTIKEHSHKELSVQIQRGSLAIQACPGFVVTEFCAGENCLPENGLVVTLVNATGA